MHAPQNKYNFEDFYNDLLCELAKVGSIFTKKYNMLNKVRIENRIIYVSTKKSKPEFKEIPLKFIQKSFEALLKNKEISQSYLSKSLYVKRSAFIISAFSLLKYIEYNEEKNSISIK